jgi:flagellar hook-basal body complex protein FliE
MSMAVNVLNGVANTATQGSALPGLGTIAQSSKTSNATQEPFGDLLTSTVNQVSGLQDQARAAVEGLMSGSGVDIHQAMIATQKADMAFEFALSVRNKAVQAYQQVMQMQF